MSTPRAEVNGRRARRLSWRHAAAVLLAILALGLPAVRVDAMPRISRVLSRRSPRRWVRARRRGVIALTTAPVGRDPLAAVPNDFPAVMGYVPAPARTPTRWDRPARQAHRSMFGARRRRVPGSTGCKVHDYGYDLLRYAHAGGQRLTAEARRQLDAMFDRDLHARCQATRPGLARAGLPPARQGFTAVVSVNSLAPALQQPHQKSFARLVARAGHPNRGRAIMARLVRRRGTRARRAGGRLRALADATPASRDRYVDFLRVVSIVTVVLGHWTIAAVALQ